MIPIIKAISLGTGPALLVELKSGSFKKLQPQAKLESFPANSTFLGAPRPPFLLLTDFEKEKVRIDTTIEEISGAPFSGNFAALEVAIGALVEQVNSILDSDAIHKNIGGEISTIALKATPVALDLILIEDSVDSNNKKKVEIGSLSSIDSDAIHKNIAGEISTIALKATPVAGDLIIIEDSVDSNNKKKVTIGSLPSSSPAPVILSPPQITGNQDNYNPVGWAASDIVILDVNSPVNITGFEAVLGYNEKMLVNTHTMHNIKIKNNDALSLAANRILCPDNKDYDLKKTASITIRYLDVLARWQIIGKH